MPLQVSFSDLAMVEYAAASRSAARAPPLAERLLRRRPGPCVPGATWCCAGTPGAAAPPRRADGEQHHFIRYPLYCKLSSLYQLQNCSSICHTSTETLPKVAYSYIASLYSFPITLFG